MRAGPCTGLGLRLWEAATHPVTVVPAFFLAFHSGWGAAAYGMAAVMVGSATAGNGRFDWYGPRWRQLMWGMGAAAMVGLGMKGACASLGSYVIVALAMIGAAASRRFRPSLHAAGWALVAAVGRTPTITVAAMAMGGLVAWQRWRCRRHSTLEIAAGAAIGTAAGLLICSG